MRAIPQASINTADTAATQLRGVHEPKTPAGKVARSTPEGKAAPPTPTGKVASPAPAGTVAPPAPAASSEAVRKSMQGNKRANTKPELLVRQRLRDAGLSGYRLQWKVPGRPDIAWPGKKVAVFINGCFWHRHKGCKMASTPKSNVEYWTFKFDRNVERDKENLRALRKAGWRVHVIWECQLKKDKIERTFARLLPKLAEELDKPLR